MNSKSYIIINFFFCIFFFINTSDAYAKVILNEISSATTDDWIELYNIPDATQSAVLNGFSLTDSVGNHKALDGVIEPGNYLVVDFSNWLNNGGDTVRLVRQEGLVETVLEEVTYGNSHLCAPQNGESLGILPDGNWTVLTQISKGVLNTQSARHCATPSPKPTSTPTPNPTFTPLPTSIPLPASSPKPTSRSTPKLEKTPQSSPRVLSVKYESTPSPTLEPVKVVEKTKPNLLPMLLITGGLVFILISIAAFWKKLRYNGNADEERKE